MSDNSTKIHSLGPKKLSITNRAVLTASSPNGFYHKPLLPVVTVPQPQIRYLLVQHPQFDTLVKELTVLRRKYDELLVKFDQKITQETLRANIKQVIESTHDIEVKMSRIVEDANQLASNSEEKQNQPTLEAEKVRHEKECLQIIETVNRATEKIEELEEKNAKLQKEIESQRWCKEAVEKENQRLRQMMEQVGREKEGEIQTLRKELDELKKSNEQQAQKISDSHMIEKSIDDPLIEGQNSIKITNTHYMTEENEENQENGVDIDLSGFSRLTINGEASRLSRVYE